MVNFLCLKKIKVLYSSNTDLLVLEEMSLVLIFLVMQKLKTLIHIFFF